MRVLRVIWHLSFFTAPVVAGWFGYRYCGWLGALIYPITAMALVGLAPVLVIIVGAFIKYHSDRSRVFKLSTAQLELIVTTPTNADFQFAYAALAKRGIDVQNVRQSLLALLTSKDGEERFLGLERLGEIFPGLYHVLIALDDESPETLQTHVHAILNRHRQRR